MASKTIFLYKRKSPFTEKSLTGAVSVDMCVKDVGDYAGYVWSAFKTSSTKWDLGFKTITTKQLVSKMNKEWNGIAELAKIYPGQKRRFIRINTGRDKRW